MISLSAIVPVIVQLVIAGLIFWLLWWLVVFTNPPEPFQKVAKVLLAIVAVLVVIGLLLTISGGPPLFRP